MLLKQKEWQHNTSRTDCEKVTSTEQTHAKCRRDAEDAVPFAKAIIMMLFFAELPNKPIVNEYNEPRGLSFFFRQLSRQGLEPVPRCGDSGHVILVKGKWDSLSKNGRHYTSIFVNIFRRVQRFVKYPVLSSYSAGNKSKSNEERASIKSLFAM